MARCERGERTQLSVYPWTAIGAAALVVNATNMLDQRSMGIAFLFLPPLSPGIVAAPRYFQHTTLQPNRMPPLVLLDEPVFHLASFE